MHRAGTDGRPARPAHFCSRTPGPPSPPLLKREMVVVPTPAALGMSMMFQSSAAALNHAGESVDVEKAVAEKATEFKEKGGEIYVEAGRAAAKS